MADDQPNGHKQDDGSDDRRIVHRVEIAPRTIVAIALTIGAVYLLNALLPILVVIVIALMLVGTLSPSVRWFQHHGLTPGRFDRRRLPGLRRRRRRDGPHHDPRPARRR